jgi:ABC-2 type transport system permease protein
MSLYRIYATASRVLLQLRHDPRTIALVLLVPSLLMIILRWVFDDAVAMFNQVALMVLAIFPFTVMFLVTSVATLRERRAGTLERLMTLPIAKLDILLGYALAFAALSFVQAVAATTVTTRWLGVAVAGGEFRLIVVSVLAGLLGLSCGLFLSAFASSEFQAVQFMPAFVVPQILTCGLFAPRDSMATALQWFSNVMPLTYLVDAMKQVAVHSEWTGSLTQDVLIVCSFILGALLLGAATLRRTQA